MKLKITFGLAFPLLALVAMAQSTKPEMSRLRSKQDPITTANQPLTPKTAMPQQRHSSMTVSKAGANNDRANAELSGLERQKIVASKPEAAPQIRLKTPPSRPAAGSDINASYQKPNPQKN
jgi:hypothetical protein